MRPLCGVVQMGHGPQAKLDVRRSALLIGPSDVLGVEVCTGVGLSRAAYGLTVCFPGGKEELAVEAVQSGSRGISELFERTAERSSLAADLVLEIGLELPGGFEESGFVEGCPLATVTIETAPASEALRAACEAAYADWLRVLSALLVQHEVPFERSQSLAMLTLGAWGGALVISRARCDTEPLRLITSELAELVGREAGQR